MTRGVEASSFLPLPTATFHILLALQDQEKHGYAIMRDVEHLTEGLVKMGPGTMYGSIKRMLGEGLIEETDTPSDAQSEDERRRYYRSTQLGEVVRQAEVERIAKLLKNASSKRAMRHLGPAS